MSDEKQKPDKQNCISKHRNNFQALDSVKEDFKSRIKGDPTMSDEKVIEMPKRKEQELDNDQPWSPDQMLEWESLFYPAYDDWRTIRRLLSCTQHLLVDRKEKEGFQDLRMGYRLAEVYLGDNAEGVVGTYEDTVKKILKPAYGLVELLLRLCVAENGRSYVSDKVDELFYDLDCGVLIGSHLFPPDFYDKLKSKDKP